MSIRSSAQLWTCPGISFAKPPGISYSTLTKRYPGIPEADLERVIDPFFTTRRSAGGTGFGLSVSSRIVRDHGGALSFRSQAGRGTTAVVSLPAGNG